MALSTMASAANVHAGHENLHKRDVEQFVKVVYQKNLVYVDQNGSPVTTELQGYSTGLVRVDPTTTSTEAAAATSSEQPTSLVALYVDPTSSSTEAVAATTSTSEAPAATTSTTEVAAAPATTSTTEVAAAPTTTSTTQAAAATTVASSSGSGEFSGQGTYYDTGLGSCGITSASTDYIVAISHELMDSSYTANPNNNPYCGKKIRAYRNGKSVDVTVVDRCTGCALDDLDFSPSAFLQLAATEEGRVDITWEWI
jgi:hypothetical protein